MLNDAVKPFGALVSLPGAEAGVLVFLLAYLHWQEIFAPVGTAENFWQVIGGLALGAFVGVVVFALLVTFVRAWQHSR